MPFLRNNLVYSPAPHALALYQEEKTSYDASRVPVYLEQDLFEESVFGVLNAAVGYGLLRVLDGSERPTFRDVAILRRLPNELPAVAGAISLERQTPLSHVNLRAVQDGVPNAYIGNALGDPAIAALVGKYVRFEVAADPEERFEWTDPDTGETVSRAGFSIIESTAEDVAAHHAARRPEAAQTPSRNLAVTSYRDLDAIAFSDSDAFGVKAANLAVLRTLGLTDVAVPDGYALPFYYRHGGSSGEFTSVAMGDAGDDGDAAAGDGVFTARVPAYADELPRYLFTYSLTAAEVTDDEVDAGTTPSTLAINELMASNGVTISDPQGDDDDWIELLNSGTEAIDLSGMYLSDKRSNPLQWQFPEGTVIAAGGYLLVWADDDSGDTPGLHTNFKLSAGGESVVLSDIDARGNVVIDSVDFPALATDVSYGRSPEATGAFGVLDVASPGRATPVVPELAIAAAAVVINELMASNGSTVADPQGEYDDWIELFNTTASDIDLSGMYLSDNRAKPKKWQFPEGTSIGSDDRLLAWADDDVGDSPGLHANFKLSAGGESVVLTDTDDNGNAEIDAVDFPALARDESYARSPDGTGPFRVVVAASPGTVSADATLSSLDLTDVDIGSFDPGTLAYAAEVGHAVKQTTVTVTPSDAGARVRIADPDGSTTGTTRSVSLGVGRTEISVTVTAADGVTRRTYTVTVTRAAAPLTGRFVSVPWHEGAGTAATLRLEFSAPVSTSYATLRDESFAVTDGTVRNARRVDGRSDLWDIEIAPDSDADVGVALPETTDCAASGAVCAADGRRLSHRLEATVAGPLALTPAVAGVPQVGRRLEATLDGTVPSELTHAWLRDGEEIAGATAAAHVLTGADAGARVSVRVSSGGRTATSAATIPVWGLPGNPPLGADEEELLGTVLTVGSTDAYPLRLGGYGRLSKAEFGALESTALGGGDLSAAFVNDIGDFTLVLPRATAAVEDLTAVWDGYRIGPLVDGASSEGPYVTGKTPQPRAAYLRYLDGSSDGVRVALSVRRKVRPPAASVTAVAESVSEGERALFEVTLERAPGAPLAVSVSVTAAGEVLAGEAPASVSFAAGETTARLAVATRDDRVVEGDGSVTATLAEGDGYRLGETTAAAVTVEDDDTATFALTVEPAALAEGGTSTVRVRIEDGATFADAKTIVLAVTGPAASDYALEPETLELAAGASAATAAFAALADESDEAPEAARIAARVDGAEVASATVTIRDASTDARLAALALTDVDIGAFDAETTVYDATVANEVASTTVTAEPADANAAVAIADTVGSTLGTVRTSRLADGTNEIAATVTAEDLATTRTYTVTVTRSSSVSWGTHLPERDIALGGGGESTGVWSDGETLWALADWDGGAAQAYELATGKRLPSCDLRLDDGFSQTALWSDGITLWAASFYGGARAYALADGARLAERDLGAALSAAGNDRPTGLWSDGSTRYAADLDDARLYAYASDGTRIESLEFWFRKDDVQGGWPWGLWSDGETLVTSWHGRGWVLAYRLSDGARLPERDIDTGAAGNDDPRDLWSDGETLWVADGEDRKLYAYAAPGLVRPEASALLPVRVANRAHAVPSADPGRPVSIPDAGLRGRVAAALGKAADAPIGAHELLALESLDARGAGVADLAGLEHAANLVAIDLGENPLVDLRPLAALAQLEALNLDATGADAWAVAALGGLTRLSLRDNGVGDVSALGALTRLRALDLAGNVIEDVTPLGGLVAVEALDLRGNPVTDLAPLAALPALVRLDADSGSAASGSGRSADEGRQR